MGRSRRRKGWRSGFLLFLVSVFVLCGSMVTPSSHAYALDDDLAKTPPMGWNSWNRFGCQIDEQLILDTAKAMVESGMKDAGYEYVNIDDCWMDEERDENGNYVADPERFPHGIKWLVDQIHDMGLKVGIYSSNGAMTCQGLPGGYGHEKEDAQKYAEWGIDYLKYDWCYSPELHYSADIDKISVNGVDYEAEDGTLEGGANVADCANCSGERKVGNIGNNSGSLTFDNVRVTKSGHYELTIYYANFYWEDGIPNRSVYVSVNGGEGQKVEFVNTGGWDSVKTATVQVQLESGDNTIKFYNPWTKHDNAKYAYTRMRDALDEAYAGTGRDIVFSLCEWGSNEPWLWAKDVGHLWRTTGDISDNWGSVLNILDQQVGLEKYAGPGHWNDPDMLEVGNGGMTNTEYTSHFSLWSILAAPLLAGNDLRNMDEATKDILTNQEVIEVNQDPLGVQGKKIRDDGDQEVWVKPLQNGDRAVVLFNRGSSAKTIQVNANDIGMPNAPSYVLRDLWKHTETVTAGEIVAHVPSHGVAMYRVKPGTPNAAPPLITLSFDSDKYIQPGETNELTSTITNYGRIAIRDIHVQLDVPEGWGIEDSTTHLENLPPGKSAQIDWLVTPPRDAEHGTVTLEGTASFVYGDQEETDVHTEASVRIPPPVPDHDAYLSDIDWVWETNGWGPVERDSSNGEQASSDGNTMTIGGVEYEKGLGVHAPSEVTYYLGGKFSKFTADIGVDDEVGDRGSVVFQVWADDEKVYESDVVTGSDAAEKVNVDISGAEELKLVVTDGGDDKNYDHANWADAKILKYPSAVNMKELVEQLEAEGEIQGDEAPHSLKIHLNAVTYYEEKELADKVVKHMEGFKQLLDYQMNATLISERAYHILKADADNVIQKWQSSTLRR